MPYIPDQGDIVKLDFDPSAGAEITKTRPGFVLSKKAFNEHTGFAIIAPITSTVRDIALEVKLTKHDTEISGVVLVHQFRSLDYIERRVRFIGKASQKTTEKVIKIAQVLIAL